MKTFSSVGRPEASKHINFILNRLLFTETASLPISVYPLAHVLNPKLDSVALARHRAARLISARQWRGGQTD